jgi:hypothetical protein
LGDPQALYAEAYANRILSEVESSEAELTEHQIGKFLLRSIDKENDPETLIALKQLGAKIYGIDKGDTDYQQVLTVLDDSMTADDLRDYITYLYEWLHGNSTETSQFVNEQMNELSGFRVEASFARLAQATGLNFRTATRTEDHKGVDFMVEDVPFDLKSSEPTAKYHTAKHKKAGNRIHAVKFVPPITAEDFEGRLVIPNNRINYILETTDFRTMVHDAIRDYRAANPTPTLPSQQPAA